MSLGRRALTLARAIALCTAALLAPPAAADRESRSGAAVVDQAELELRREETALLHRRLDLSELARYQPERPPAAAFTAARPQLAPVTVVHVWAVECHACVEEFRVLRQVVQSFTSSLTLKFLLLSETADPTDLATFLTQRRADTPQAEHYQVRGERLRSSLQNRTQPTTLILDQRGLVRQAFLGSLLGRRGALAESLARLQQNQAEGPMRVLPQLPEPLPTGLGPGEAEELRSRRTEEALLHARLIVPAPAPPRPAPALTLVHLFRPEAEQDLPLLQRVARSFHRERALRFLFLCDEEGGAPCQSPPPAPQEGERAALPAELRRALASRARPLTLLLDAQGAVRHALVGPLQTPTDRRNELAEALERLLRAARPHR